MKNAFGIPQTVLILGGGSDLGLSVAQLLVGRGTEHFILAGRDVEAMRGAASSVLAGAKVDYEHFDATDVASHQEFVREVAKKYGDLDVALLAFGLLGDQQEGENNPAVAAGVLTTNLTGAASVALALFEPMMEQRHGSIVLFSSIAAARTRRANFIYGASKVGVDAFFQGLQDRAHGTGVHVMIVRPGFVVTKMTAHMKKMPMPTTPQRVARDVVRGILQGKSVVWSPPTVRLMAYAIKMVPRPIWRRMKI